MSSCHKHQQQRYHNENTRTCMFIHYMYVDVFFPLTKAITIMFEHVTTHYQTLQTWIGHDATRYHPRYHTFSLTLTWIGHNAKRYHNFNVLLHALTYIFSKFSMVWGCLKRVTIKFIKKYILIFFLKKMTVTRGNALQIAQNQENFRKNMR